ncbi:ribosome hibernation-promoting factor, HPF/YfiA family [Marinibactrum halimedae]|uniref:Ribosomal subunit interface protein n=1 Tax=Marinibactrum halimedae TaxID=1444977 RepID=A0AA37T3V5_9GAMM|nr:ribosome-associated translation inhibitor RaiA [Marinibactrum halimedae]MCD9458148.1 ribosome-associated translation inhibitor RaiA [Marinibactrum halimedae]GLS25081.1 ribosomal subunit interface protein [Marinibactrum halimedae]
MQINLSGHHVEVTEALRQCVHAKLSKVFSHNPSLSSISVVLNVEPKQQSVEMITQFMGTQVAIRAVAQDLYEAIPSAAKKLEAALKHRKGQVKSHGNTRVSDNITDGLSVAANVSDEEVNNVA